MSMLHSSADLFAGGILTRLICATLTAGAAATTASLAAGFLGQRCGVGPSFRARRVPTQRSRPSAGQQSGGCQNRQAANLPGRRSRLSSGRLFAALSHPKSQRSRDDLSIRPAGPAPIPHSANPNPSWYGGSIGDYEGDELVVDTIGLNDNTFVPMLSMRRGP